MNYKDKVDELVRSTSGYEAMAAFERSWRERQGDTAEERLLDWLRRMREGATS